MTDLRDQVVEDRGVIKKIQLIFPGYQVNRLEEIFIRLVEKGAAA